MRIPKLATLAACCLLAAILAAGGCSKVKDPEAPAGAGKVVEGQAAPTAPQGPAPQIACDQPNFDFGNVSQGETATHTFTIKNTGKGVLKIERARGG